MTSSDQASAGSSARRTRIILIALAAVLVVAIAVTLFFLARGAGATPQASPTPSVTESGSGSPTPAPPERSAVALPASCEDAFSADYFATRTAYPYNPLNHETVASSPILTVEKLEALRAGLPHLRCTWAGAGEEGILGSINEVTRAEAGQVLLQLKEEGFDCTDHRGGTACSSGLAVSEETGGTIMGEEHFLRDNIWISTFWVNIDIAGYNDDIIDVLWGDAQR